MLAITKGTLESFIWFLIPNILRSCIYYLQYLSIVSQLPDFFEQNRSAPQGHKICAYDDTIFVNAIIILMVKC